MEQLKNNSDVLGFNKEFLFQLIIFIIGLIIGFNLGHEEEQTPYSVWMEGTLHIAQKANSYVYTYANMGDGTYELNFIMGPKSPAYPSRAR